MIFEKNKQKKETEVNGKWCVCVFSVCLVCVYVCMYVNESHFDLYI
jgi:hypothetical protein